MPTIKLNTEIPGPKSCALTERRAQAVPRGVYASTPLFIRRAEGATLEDVDGNRIIDLGGGIGCINVGHRNPRVMQALRTQLDAFLHLCFSVTGYEGYVELAEKLNHLTPGEFPKKTFLVNSGAEAVENAVKIARAHTGRPAVLCVEDAFHGRTMLGLTLTSKTHPYKQGFGPFLSDVYRIPFGVPADSRLRSGAPMSPASRSHEQVEQLFDGVFRRVVSADSVAAVVVEPVLGEGGFVVPPAGFLPALADICRRHGIVFIADEVQTGFGRTGELFACTHFGLEPDLILTAKSPGGGMPLAAVTGRAEIMDAPGPGGLGGTFGGNPASCAAALAVIETIEKENLSARAELLGEKFASRAREWARRWPLIGEVRGLGAMQALELVRSRETREPAKAETEQIMRYCYEHGLLTISAGTYGNVIRLLVPLMTPDAQFDEGLDVLEGAFAAVSEKKEHAEPRHA